MVGVLKANIARLERERVRDHQEALARVRRLEQNNATIVSSLARRLKVIRQSIS